MSVFTLLFRKVGDVVPHQLPEALTDTAALFSSWLAKLPLRDIRIEPVGLRTIYDRYHRPEQTGKGSITAQDPDALAPSPETEEALR